MTAEEFNDCRHKYLKVTSQAPARLTVATFLTGLTFAAFAALLSVPGVPTHLFDGAKRPSSFGDNELLAVCAVLLGATTMVLLLATLSTYVALQEQADIAPSAAKLFQDGLAEGAQPPQQVDAGAHPSVSVDERDVRRINAAFAAYDNTRILLPSGLGLLFASLIAVAFRIDLLVGAATAIVFVVGVAGLKVRHSPNVFTAFVPLVRG